MEKIDHIWNDPWLKQKANFWLTWTKAENDGEAHWQMMGLIDGIANHYTCLTYFDGRDIYVIGHANLDRCIIISRVEIPEWDGMYSMGNGGLYLAATPDAIKQTLAAAMAGRREDADHRAAKKSCALH